MNLPQIQTEIFRQLVGMETLLKDDYAIEIIKHVNGAFSGRLFKKSGGCYLCDFWIETEVITTTADITAEINRIWQAIPAECRKTTLTNSWR